MTSMPKDVYEPDAYFYWPPAVIGGRPGPWLPVAPVGRTTLPVAGLEAAAAWAQPRKTNALIIIHRGKVQLERYWNGMLPDQLANGRALTRAPPAARVPLEAASSGSTTPSRSSSPSGARPRGRITVRQLAQNVSGLEVAPSLPVSVVYGNKDLYLAYGGDVVRAAMNYPAVHPPGTRSRSRRKTPAAGTGDRARHRHGGADAAVRSRLEADLRVRRGLPVRPPGRPCARDVLHARDAARLGTGRPAAGAGRQVGGQTGAARWLGETMATPSARKPNFGLGLWLGNPYVAKRAYFEGQPGVIPQSEPFLADDVRIMEGGGNRTLFIVPSKQLVILRHGQQVPDGTTPRW